MSPFAIASVLFGTHAAGDGRVGVALTGAPFAVFVLARLRYFTALAWRLGRTLGKRLLGVRVVGRRLRLGHLAAGTAIARARPS